MKTITLTLIFTLGGLLITVLEASNPTEWAIGLLVTGAIFMLGVLDNL